MTDFRIYESVEFGYFLSTQFHVIPFAFILCLLGARIIWCVVLLFSVVVNAQRESRWTWTANNRNSVDGPNDRPTDRRKYETVEDFR